MMNGLPLNVDETHSHVQTQQHHHVTSIAMEMEHVMVLSSTAILPYQTQIAISIVLALNHVVALSMIHSSIVHQIQTVPSLAMV